MSARVSSPPPKSLVDQRQTWALRLIPVTAAIGPNFFQMDFLGVGLFAFRFLVAGLLVLTLGSLTRWRAQRMAQMFLLLCLGWTVWSALSLLWAPSLEAGLQQTMAIGFGLAVAVVLFNLGLNKATHLDALLEGWMIAYALAGVFAVRELLTGEYLPGSVAELFAVRAIDGIAISFFFNPNNYAAFIVLCVPFMLLAYHRAPTKRRKRLALLLLGSTPVLIFFTTSRLALMGILVMFVVYAAIGLETPRQLFRYLALGATVVALIGGVFWSGSRTASDVEKLLNSDIAVGGSDTMRWNLTKNGLWMTLDSGGIGVGAGGYQVVTETEDVPYFVDNALDPHNFWVEVLSQHGVLVFVALLAWFGRMIAVASRVRRLAAYGANPLMFDASVAILVGLSGYLFASVANSTFLTQSTNWVFLGTLAALSANLDYSSWSLEKRGKRRPGKSLWPTL